MSSLKEIKTRISSIDSTKKITSAMKMVASAKLRKAQKNIESFLPYEKKLNGILQKFLATDSKFSSPYLETRNIKKVAIIVISSNTSLCGSFNSTVIRELNSVVEKYRKVLKEEQILVFPIGKKANEATRKIGFTSNENFDHLVDKPNYENAMQFAKKIMMLFTKKEIDKVELIYQHFKSTASQQLIREDFLPFSLNTTANCCTYNNDYIIEPDKTSILNDLLPKSLQLKIYTILLDSYAAEQAARTLSMQTATDNADELLQDLTIQYNKSRQQAITNELLDIIGGSQH